MWVVGDGAPPWVEAVATFWLLAFWLLGTFGNFFNKPLEVWKGQNTAANVRWLAFR